MGLREALLELDLLLECTLPFDELRKRDLRDLDLPLFLLERLVRLELRGSHRGRALRLLARGLRGGNRHWERYWN
ncbi:MAG: hypothetical protein JRJ80_13635, partial [Deltaproteobacteria bacterium]|nr:hypothetical protein [Deltaproteobacteria bacterium]